MVQGGLRDGKEVARDKLKISSLATEPAALELSNQPDGRNHRLFHPCRTASLQMSSHKVFTFVAQF